MHINMFNSLTDLQLPKSHHCYNAFTHDLITLLPIKNIQLTDWLFSDLYWLILLGTV